MVRHVFIVLAMLLSLVSAVGAQEQQQDLQKKSTRIVPTANALFEFAGVAVKFSLSSQQVYSRQMLAVNYDIWTNDAFISLKASTSKQPGVGSVPLRAKKSNAQDASRWRYHYTYKVMLHTAATGDRVIEIPSLEYSEGGKLQHRFDFAAQKITILPLPDYLPPYMPLTDIKVVSTVDAQGPWYSPLQTDKLYYWNVLLSAENVTADILPEIRQQIKSDADIQFLPAQITSKEIRKQGYLIQQVQYSIPLMFLGSARHALPDITIQYFSTASGRIMQNKYKQQPLYVVNVYLKWLLIFIIVLILAWVFAKLQPWVMSCYKNLRLLYAARRRLSQARTAQQVRMAMNVMASAFGWQKNITLTQWQQSWCKTFAGRDDITLFVNDLSEGLYRQGSNNGGSASARMLLGASRWQQWLYCMRIQHMS